MYKYIVSQKKESTLNHLNKFFFFLNESQTLSCWCQNEILTYSRPLVARTQTLISAFGLNQNANVFFATWCRFKKLTNTALNEIDQSPQISITQRSCLEKLIVERIVWESMRNYIYIYAFSRRFYPKRLTLHSSYSFYIFWRIKVKKKSVRKWKCFLTLHACQHVVGDSQNQNMNLSFSIIGAF